MSNFLQHYAYLAAWFNTWAWLVVIGLFILSGGNRDEK